MENLLHSAINNETNEEFTFFLDGDLSQMSSQKSVLNRNGIITKQNNVYPCLKEKDIPKAMEIIWNSRVEGWWHYKELYVKHNICTAKEFDERLSY